MATVPDEPKTLLAEKSFPSAETTSTCPYEYYAALRSEAPVFKLPDRENEYVVSRHEDIFYVTRHPELFSSHHSVFEDGWMRRATLDDHANPDYAWGIVTSDPPQHTWKRKLAFEMFKPGRLKEREPTIRQYADELIDAFVDRGEVEFVSEFADLLPAKVILTLFGLPQDYLERALAWGRYEGFGTRFASPENQQAARDSITDLGLFIRDRILERVDDPGDDDLSVHVQNHVANRGQLEMGHLIAEASNLFIGGIITTTHLIGGMMLLFLQNPDQLDKVRADHSLLKKAIEESLRAESPVQMGPRLVLEDTEVGGVPIPAGSTLIVVWGSANRDEAIFDCPERFDIERSNAKDHVAFGNGPHFCLGAPLGRLEARIAFEQLFTRLGEIRLAPGKNDFANHHAVIFRGPEKLYLEFDAAD